MEAVGRALARAGTRAVCAAELWEVLQHEHLGSALDVKEAVGEMLLDQAVEPGDVAHVCALLFEELGTRGGKMRRLDLEHTRDSGTCLESIEWKREFKGDSARFLEDYRHTLQAQKIGETPRTLIIEQRPFGPEGFASTVWDSAIVLARLFEHRAPRSLISQMALNSSQLSLKCIELGAGCGLVGLTLAALGADVVLTDLQDNLRLLRANVRANAPLCTGVVPRVRPLKWGQPLTAELRTLVPYDLVVATDVVYSHEAVPDLVTTLLDLSGPRTTILLAAGRNRHAIPQFFDLAQQKWSISVLEQSELDPVYQSQDVNVWKLVPLSQ